MCLLINKSATPLNLLRNEYGTASNIKSNVTRKNVLDAITKAQQKLKLFKDPGEKGIVIFTGALPQRRRLLPEPNEWKPMLLFHLNQSEFSFIDATAVSTPSTFKRCCVKKKHTVFCSWTPTNATIATLQGKHFNIVVQMHSVFEAKPKQVANQRDVTNDCVTCN